MFGIHYITFGVKSLEYALDIQSSTIWKILQNILGVRATLEHCGGCTVTQADRGENQREKSNVSQLPVSPYYTTLDYTHGHYLVCTDPALCRPLTDSGCMYVSYFTSTVTLEVKVEWSSDLRAEQSLEV